MAPETTIIPNDTGLEHHTLNKESKEITFVIKDYEKSVDFITIKYDELNSALNEKNNLIMEEYNADEMVPPTWLNKDFFEVVLRAYEKDSTITISDLKITPGSFKGDHLASIIFRVVAKYNSTARKLNSRSMIVKTIPDEEGFKKDVLQDATAFKTEIGMYSEELPKFKEILRKHGDNTQFCAKIIYHTIEPRKVIVFEDLVHLGYVCIRDRFINVEELKACLSKVAKLHAVSYKSAMENDESVKNFKSGLLSESKDKLPEFIAGGLKLLADAVAKVDDLHMYAEKLHAMEATFIDKCNDVFNAHSRGHKGIMVLNHGDLHGRNVMFKYDKNDKLEDVMLIDYQISVFGPAVIDIAYSIHMLFDENLRRNHREEMIYYYFSIFLETLKRIEYAGEMPTLTDFYIDMYRYKDYELWTMATFLPLVHSLCSGTVETEELVCSDDAQRSMYLVPSFIDELRWMLPKYLYMGYIE